MPIRMPDLAFDVRVFKTRNKPRACIETRAFTREDRVAGLLSLQPDGFECGNRVGIQVYGSCRPILGLCEVDDAAVKMDLAPCERMLFRQPSCRY